jgi:PadR family transcriptional regulator, regulatory protein AphA
MIIQYAILGLLSWQPFSGYDLKKIISDSTVFYWSGNNNQIYRTLVQLHEEGMVTQQVQYQESLPAKKIYTITEKGREDLRKWLLSAPELPELHNNFLIQLAWADQLSEEEIDALLAKYEEELHLQLKMQAESNRRGKEQTPARSPREVFLWKKIMENVMLSYQRELDWVRQFREEMKENTGSFKENL